MPSKFVGDKGQLWSGLIVSNSLAAFLLAFNRASKVAITSRLLLEEIARSGGWMLRMPNAACALPEK